MPENLTIGNAIEFSGAMPCVCTSKPVSGLPGRFFASWNLRVYQVLVCPAGNTRWGGIGGSDIFEPSAGSNNNVNARFSPPALKFDDHFPVFHLAGSPADFLNHRVCEYHIPPNPKTSIIAALRLCNYDASILFLLHIF